MGDPIALNVQHLTKTYGIEPNLQRSTVHRFPNVSVIDLGIILSTVDTILDKVALVVRFMAFFSVSVGLVVLVGVIASSH